MSRHRNVTRDNNCIAPISNPENASSPFPDASKKDTVGPEMGFCWLSPI